MNTRKIDAHRPSYNQHMATKTFPHTADGIVDYGPAPKGDKTWKRWGVDITVHRGKGGRVRKRYRTKTEAEAAREDLRRRKNLGMTADIGAASRTNFTTLHDSFMQSPAIRRTSERNQSDLREQWRNLLERHWGMQRIDNANYPAIEAWAGTLADSHSVKRQRDAIKLLTRLLGHAVGEGYLPRNPAYRPNGKRDYMPPEQKATGDGAAHALTARQLHRLTRADVMDGYQDVVLFAGTTGLRWQEWARLEVQDVDARKGVVTVTKALSTVRGRGHEFRGRQGLIDSPTKTHETRTVPVLPEVLEKIGHRLEARRDELLFNLRGRPISYTTFARRMADASAQAGTVVAATQEQLGLRPSGFVDSKTLEALPDDVASRWGLQADDEDFRALTPHGLRHTAITALINSGVPVTAVQRWAGHASPTITLNTYSHLYNQDLGTAADVLSDWLAG